MPFTNFFDKNEKREKTPLTKFLTKMKKGGNAIYKIFSDKTKKKGGKAMDKFFDKKGKIKKGH